MPFIDPAKIPNIGHQRIDDGHRGLAMRVNELYALWQGKGQSQGGDEELLFGFERLLRYIGRHFAEEEAIGAEVGYQNLELHQARHRELLAQISAHVHRLYADDGSLRRDLVIDIFSTVDILLYEHEIVDDQDFWPLFRNGSPPIVRSAEVLVWDHSLAIGLAEVDQQHQQLTMLVNRLSGLLFIAAPKAVVGSALDATLAHTRFHFSWEERYAKDHALPGFERHARLHQDLLVDFQGVIDRYEAGDYNGMDEVLRNYLRFWLIDHILHVDTALVGK